MKRDFTSDFKEIKKMTNKIRNLNEAVNFSEEDYDDYGMEPGDDYEMDGECPNGMCDQRQQRGGMQPQTEDEELEAEAGDPESAVNQIREIALKGMVALCKTPDDPQYEVLKQVFTYIDRANKKNKEEEK